MKIKQILFDLGGVVLDIEYNKSVEAFRAYGFDDFDRYYTQAAQSGLFDDFEIGAMSEEEFIQNIQVLCPIKLEEEQIRQAWNALLLPWNPKRLALIDGLRKQYRLFLYSNTNSIHKQFFDASFPSSPTIPNLDSLFEKAYFSHLFGKRKPHPESFKALLKENNLKSEETLFIDDSIQHVLGAKEAGLHAFHLKNLKLEDLNFDTLDFLVSN